MITIGFSTREDNPKYQQYLQKTCMFKECQVIQKINNGDKSLSEVYNEILDESTNDIVVFVHDDLEFDTNNWGVKLMKLFERNPEQGIIGLAGTKYFSDNGCWWTVQGSMYGVVNHKHEGKKWTSSYSKDLGNKIEPTVIVDGLFIALNKNNIKHAFDETIDGFHFYDLGFCLPNYLEGVPVGVTTQIRVTHLSIGQTNQQWEDNRVKFAEKYKESLPIDISPKDLSETFIFCHDQDLIIGFEENKKFKNLYNYTYVFLGIRPVDKISHLPNLIVARDLEYNREEYPLFTSYTGWYALWKNGLVKTKYLNLFEYDVVLNENIDQQHVKLYNNNVDLIGYVPFPMSNVHFIQYKEWTEFIAPAIKEVHKTDIFNFFGRVLQQNPQSVWSSTSNTTFRADVFDEYMKWFEPLVPFIKDTKTCGHAHERSITFFTHLRKKQQVITNGLLKHLQLDSHKTQGHDVDMSESIQKLFTNQS